MRGDAKRERALALQFPDSEPCACGTCGAYCARPGWWTVHEAAAAIEAGYGGRMMLEIAPERTFAVLAPAFQGCERSFAFQEFARRGCTFLGGGRCELHGSGFQPIECRFCHHDRIGQGPQCHAALEREWRTAAGQSLVARWARTFRLWEDLKRFGVGGNRRPSCKIWFRGD